MPSTYPTYPTCPNMSDTHSNLIITVDVEAQPLLEDAGLTFEHVNGNLQFVHPTSFPPNDPDLTLFGLEEIVDNLLGSTEFLIYAELV